MINRLNQLIKDFDEISQKMSDPSIIADIKTYSQLAKDHRRLDGIIPQAKAYIQKMTQLKEDEEILQGNDRELKELVKDEIGVLRDKLETLENELLVQTSWIEDSIKSIIEY